MSLHVRRVTEWTATVGRNCCAIAMLVNSPLDRCRCLCVTNSNARVGWAAALLANYQTLAAGNVERPPAFCSEGRVVRCSPPFTLGLRRVLGGSRMQLTTSCMLLGLRCAGS